MWYVWWLKDNVYYHRTFKTRRWAYHWATILKAHGHSGVQVRQGEI
ncbi:hypothetical protein SEA_STEAMEDHAMS_50 [Gordonia phage SteamedHams]|nr:hypothetical protein SEA_STEAMEDHAMS_50 [Gordonia phage SteamedHams]